MGSVSLPSELPTLLQNICTETGIHFFEFMHTPSLLSSCALPNQSVVLWNPTGHATFSTWAKWSVWLAFFSLIPVNQFALLFLLVHRKFSFEDFKSLSPCSLFTCSSCKQAALYSSAVTQTWEALFVGLFTSIARFKYPVKLIFLLTLKAFWSLVRSWRVRVVDMESSDNYVVFIVIISTYLNGGMRWAVLCPLVIEEKHLTRDLSGFRSLLQSTQRLWSSPANFSGSLPVVRLAVCFQYVIMSSGIGNWGSEDRDTDRDLHLVYHFGNFQTSLNTLSFIIDSFIHFFTCFLDMWLENQCMYYLDCKCKHGIVLLPA